jgi:uncharacterized membrane protein
MESRVKLAGHPTHSMLIVLPLGLLSIGVVFDIVSAKPPGGTPVGAG